MKKLIFLVLLSLPLAAIAKDEVVEHSVSEAMSIHKVANALGDEVQFYFAGQDHPKVVRTYGEFKTNKKTNAFRKTEKTACQWAFASAMKALKRRALREGGNAVINIRSNYKNVETSSSTTFKCGAGNVVAGVALIGDVVEL